MNEPNRTVAVFDFDHTLIEGDSLWPFLVCVAGWPRAFMALAKIAIHLALHYVRNPKAPELADIRTFVKEQLLIRLLARRGPHEFGPAIDKLRRWQKWNVPLRQKLIEHYERGHRVVIASGGLDLYLPDLLKDLPAYDLLCTEVEIRDDIVTGAMPAGNCVRARKAERLAAYLAAHGPFEESWGYGNFPHDVPMLELLRHRIIVS